MKLRILLSIFFIIVTTFTAVHELKHIYVDDSSSCSVCIVDHLVSADINDEVKEVEVFRFEKISHDNLVSHLYIKEKNNQNRAPPQIS